MSKKKVIKAKSKPAAKKPAAKKPVKPAGKAKKPAVKKAAPKKAVVKKAVAKKPVAKKAAPKKVVAKKAAPKKAVAPKKVVAKKPVKAVVKPVAKPLVKGVTKKETPAPVKAKATVPAAKKVEPKIQRVPERNPVLPPMPPPIQPAISKSPLAPTAKITYEDPSKTRYSDAELEEFRKIIQTKLDDAKRELVLLQEQLTAANDHGTDDTSNTFKMLEDGSESLAKEEAGQLAGRQKKFVEQLENALIRIENKTYGICRVTGKLIPKERLRAVPHTTQSIEAKINQYRD